MRYTIILPIIITVLCGCDAPQPNQPASTPESKQPGISKFDGLGIKQGMKRTVLEERISALVGKQSGYTDTPMGTAGGKVTYHAEGGFKIAVIYKRGSPGETGVDDKGNFTDYTPAVDEEVVSLEIKKLSSTTSTFIAPEFGKIMTIEGMFVAGQWVNTDLAKPHEHPNRYSLKVVSVDGVALKPPVTMAFRIDDAQFRPESDKVYMLAAYETIRPVGTPWGWQKRPSYYGYQLANELVVKLKE
jgi:hypothetical protein